MITRRALLLLFMPALVSLVALPVEISPSRAQTPPAELTVQPIALDGPAAERNAEISGLAWFGSTLILLAENPNIYAEDGYAGLWFALEKDAIIAYLEAVAGGSTPPPLLPTPIPIIAPDIAATIPGFDGFEALITTGESVYALIEAIDPGGTMRGYLVQGRAEPNLSSITLDLAGAVTLAPQTDLFNVSYESLLVVGDRLVAMYEINGAHVNPDPRALVFDFGLNAIDALPMPPLDYRLTDVTEPGPDGMLWAMNYYFPGEDFLQPLNEPLSARYGSGASHAAYPQVERLVALLYTGDAITLVDRPPLYLALPDADARNWEGIARLDDRGFLLVTDKYPQTILGFVPFSD